MARHTGAPGLVAVALIVAQGCDAPSPTASATATRTVQLPTFDASNFVAEITNPYYPLTPGKVFTYRSETEDGVETNVVTVTFDTKNILGVAATVVHDQVFLDGELTEDTFDWLAQDRAGNVWYLGEDSKELENGVVVSTEGSWESGINGQPGIIMLADPRPGRSYQQEDAPGIAEDQARVIGLNAKVDVPYGQFSGCLETMEFTPLERGVREHKYYCPGIGLLLERQPKNGNIRNELISITQL